MPAPIPSCHCNRSKSAGGRQASACSLRRPLDNQYHRRLHRSIPGSVGFCLGPLVLLSASAVPRPTTNRQRLTHGTGFDRQRSGRRNTQNGTETQQKAGTSRRAFLAKAGQQTGNPPRRSGQPCSPLLQAPASARIISTTSHHRDKGCSAGQATWEPAKLGRALLTIPRGRVPPLPF